MPAAKVSVIQESSGFEYHKFCESYFSTTASTNSAIHLIHSHLQDLKVQVSESHTMQVGRKDIFKSFQIQAHGTEDSLEEVDLGASWVKDKIKYNGSRNNLPNNSS